MSLDELSTDLLFAQGDAAEEAGDYARAQECFLRGTALGDDHCCTRLADMFDVGIGVPIDKAQAMKWYRQAWRKRSTVAANNIAILYRERGNRRTMFKWFERGALEGDGYAQVELAKGYLSGIGVLRNPQLALRWITAARDNFYTTEASREQAERMSAELRPRSI